MFKNIVIKLGICEQMENFTRQMKLIKNRNLLTTKTVSFLAFKDLWIQQREVSLNLETGQERTSNLKYKEKPGLESKGASTPKLF